MHSADNTRIAHVHALKGKGECKRNYKYSTATCIYYVPLFERGPMEDNAVWQLLLSSGLKLNYGKNTPDLACNRGD